MKIAMKITLEIPLSTALKLKKLAADFTNAASKDDPLIASIKFELKNRGIDITKIKIV
jgi:hypothetical protein